MRTAAMIGKDGSLDWMCYPHFDSPSIFGRLLDDEKGGYFSIQPAKEDYNTKQFYWPDTNVLITRFLSRDGVCEITDYLYNKYGAQISYDLWLDLRDLINWVADYWQQKGEGIWEMRSGPQHFVYSRLMCWVALDRGLCLANKRSFPAERQNWLRERDRIYEEIMEKG